MNILTFTALFRCLDYNIIPNRPNNQCYKTQVSQLFVTTRLTDSKSTKAVKNNLVIVHKELQVY